MPFFWKTSKPAKSEEILVKFTHVLQILPPTPANEGIRIYDITSSVTAPYPSDEFKAQVAELGLDMVDEVPDWVVHTSRVRRTMTLHEGHGTERTEESILATWAMSRWENGKNNFAFPPDSPHSTHDLTMERFDGRRTESFVQDSVQHLWKCNAWKNKLTLFKLLRGQETPVARYKTTSIIRAGGTVVVNTGEVDIVVALLTALGMELKMKQSS